MENQKDNDMVVYPEYIEGKEIVHRKYVRDEKINMYSTKDKITIVCYFITKEKDTYDYKCVT
jgi:hypothetical protein